MNGENIEDKDFDLSDVDLSTSPNIYREERILNKEKEYRKRGKDFTKIYCGNCGNLGHTYRRCKFPITSCGVMLYKINPQFLLDSSVDKYQFLLIQRKDTLLLWHHQILHRLQRHVALLPIEE